MKNSLFFLAAVVPAVAACGLWLPAYGLHLMILVGLTAVMYSGWNLMARYGLVSLGHGTFLAVGAYVPALLWNSFDLAPWLGIPLGVACAAAAGAVLGLACFRFSVIGHYFALVTLAAAEVTRLGVVALRSYTGGSLGMSLHPDAVSPWWAMQMPKAGFLALAAIVWLLTLALWQRIQRSDLAKRLTAVADDEAAAAACGVDVTRDKLLITVISAAVTALGGALAAQYRLYLNPESLAGLTPSLEIVIGCVVGGIHSRWGATLGALIFVLMGEALRVLFGPSFAGAATALYGLILVVCVIAAPGGLAQLVHRWQWPRFGRPALTPPPAPTS